MTEAARVGDTIGHSMPAGMIAGTIVGGLIAAAGAVAAGARCSSPAWRLPVSALACCSSAPVWRWGYLTGRRPPRARDGIADAGAGSLDPQRQYRHRLPNVFINGKPAALATNSQVACGDDGEHADGAGAPAQGQHQRPGRLGAWGTNQLRRAGVDGKVRPTCLSAAAPHHLADQARKCRLAAQGPDLTLLFAGLVGRRGRHRRQAGALGKLLGQAARHQQAGAHRLPRRHPDDRHCRRRHYRPAGGYRQRQKFLDGEDDLDFVLPSRLPVAWQRYWRSAPGDGVLGRGWNLFWESSLQPYQDTAAWRAPSGDFVAFPKCRAATKPTAAEKCWLMHNDDGSWQLFDVGEQSPHYPPLAGDLEPAQHDHRRHRQLPSLF
ncbi:DUF6531 domain-containing protein [Serratia ureilytica]